MLGYVRLERLKMAYYGEVVSLLLRKRSKVKNSSLLSSGFLWVLELSDQNLTEILSLKKGERVKGNAFIGA